MLLNFNNETFHSTYDGNMTSDGRFMYTWNDENRMVSASNAEVVVTYAYDHKGRMIRKDIMRTGSATVHIEYTWDGWNIIRETFRTPNSSFLIHNLWGLDLDGTMQGAGGVGGLLAVVRDGETYLPTYDANGNISEYVSAADGSIAAHYDYSPFGETLVASGTLASSFTHRFSTKPYCQTTGFCEYQMRKYNPNLGRWMSRDAANELGGPNLYCTVFNASISHFDILGNIDLANFSKCLLKCGVASKLKKLYNKLFSRNLLCKKIRDGCQENFMDSLLGHGNSIIPPLEDVFIDILEPQNAFWEKVGECLADCLKVAALLKPETIIDHSESANESSFLCDFEKSKFKYSFSLKHTLYIEPFHIKIYESQFQYSDQCPSYSSTFQSCCSCGCDSKSTP